MGNIDAFPIPILVEARDSGTRCSTFERVGGADCSAPGFVRLALVDDARRIRLGWETKTAKTSNSNEAAGEETPLSPVPLSRANRVSVTPGLRTSPPPRPTGAHGLRVPAYLPGF